LLAGEEALRRELDAEKQGSTILHDQLEELKKEEWSNRGSARENCKIV